MNGHVNCQSLTHQNNVVQRFSSFANVVDELSVPFVFANFLHFFCSQRFGWGLRVDALVVLHVLDDQAQLIGLHAREWNFVFIAIIWTNDTSYVPVQDDQRTRTALAHQPPPSTL